MAERGEPTLGELGRRMTVLEQEHEELRELVDGQESWSHRKRLHVLEDDRRAAELVSQAISELRAVRSGNWARIREWTAIAIAAAAVILAHFHGG